MMQEYKLASVTKKAKTIIKKKRLELFKEAVEYFLRFQFPDENCNNMNMCFIHSSADFKNLLYRTLCNNKKL